MVITGLVIITGKHLLTNQNLSNNYSGIDFDFKTGVYPLAKVHFIYFNLSISYKFITPLLFFA